MVSLLYKLAIGTQFDASENKILVETSVLKVFSAPL